MIGLLTGGEMFCKKIYSNVDGGGERVIGGQIPIPLRGSAWLREIHSLSSTGIAGNLSTARISAYTFCESFPMEDCNDLKLMLSA